MVSRWRLFRSVVRAALTTTGLVVVYYLMPISERWSGSALARLVIGLLVFIALVGWQLRAVLRAEYPVLRMFEALAVAIPLYLLVFASACLLAARNDPASFSELLSKTDALYFTVTVFATVGFGDITPVTAATRVMVTVQMVVNLIVIGLVLRLMLDVVKARLQERRSPGDQERRSTEQSAEATPDRSNR